MFQGMLRLRPVIYAGLYSRWLGMTGHNVVHILHISKTGGVALNTALQPYRRSGPYSLILHPHMICLRHVPRGQKVVFFLRDPVTRFVSAYNYQRRVIVSGGMHSSVSKEADIIRRWQTAQDFANGLADPKRHDQAAQDIGTLRQIRHGYTDWLSSPKALLDRSDDILFIGRQERLDEDAAKLFRLFGLTGAALPQGEQEANHAPPTSDVRLSDAGAAALRHRYASCYQIIDTCQRHLGLAPL